MNTNYYFDDISLAPLKNECKNYSWNSLRSDLIAGCNVALLTVPQAMAFALLAGLPMQCSLLASIFSAFAVALFGSSRHLIVGQSNAIAILLQAGCADILMTYKRDLPPSEYDAMAFSLLIQITFLSALMQMVAASFRLGRLTQFVSYSVIIGYIFGTSIAVIISQLYTFLGIPPMNGVHMLYEKIIYLFTHISQTHLYTALLAGGCLLILSSLKHFNRKLPIAAITFIISTIIVQTMLWIKSNEWLPHFDYLLNEQSTQKILFVGDLGSTSSIIPQLTFPFIDLTLISSMLPIAFAISLLSVLETTSSAKSLAAASGHGVSINQEIFALGIGNAISALVGAVPVAGSTSRSLLNFDSGGKTRISSLLCAFFVALICFLFHQFISQIPLAALSAVLLFTTMQFINKDQFLLCLRATNADAFVLLLTIFCCLFFSFDVAFYIGISISIVLYLKKAAVPQLIEYEIDESGELHNIDYNKNLENKIIRVIKVEGELFFGAADLFQTTLKAFAENDHSTRVLIIQLKNARDIDATTCLALQRLNTFLCNSGRHLVICGIMLPVWEVLCNANLLQEIGTENLLPFDEKHPQQHMKKALKRAKILIQKEKAAPLIVANSEKGEKDAVTIQQETKVAITNTIT